MEREKIAARLTSEWFACVYDATVAIPKEARLDPLSRKQDRLRVPVAAIKADLCANMHTRHTTAHLSGYTIGKQKDAHRDLSPADYRRIQIIMDGDLIFSESPFHRAGYWRDPAGQWWRAAWKRARDDSEVLVTSFSKAEERNVRAERRKFGDPLTRKK